jgi:hypothetical protein
MRRSKNRISGPIVLQELRSAASAGFAFAGGSALLKEMGNCDQRRCGLEPTQKDEGVQRRTVQRDPSE